MSEITRPKADPGWNDPPTLNYNSSNPPPKSRIGNKRIAFPLSGNQSVNLPPQAAPNTSIPTPPMIPIVPDGNSSNTTLLERVLQNINQAQDKLIGDSTGGVCSKLEVMKQMWMDGKFNEKMQNNIFNLSTFLAEGNLEKANQCQLQLMMEDSTLCNSWISAFTVFTTPLNK
nr:steroid receptor RNA activator 1-like [Onthophagus taurus]